MNVALLGKKIGMTQVFDDENRLVPVTVIEAGPCPVTQIKSADKDGYDAVQLGFRAQKEQRLSKAEAGHLKKAGVDPVAELQEFRTNGDLELNVGDILTVDRFEEGQKIDVIGMSKGRGFQGVVKRYGFAGGPASHGSMFHRRGGSYGMCQWPGHVIKGKKMPGHMGDVRRTVQNLQIVKIVPEKNLILIKGSVPGARGSSVTVRTAIKNKANNGLKEGNEAMKLTVFSADGSKSQEKEFSQFPVLDGDKGVAALRQVVIAQQANKRQGTASTKTRAEVSGTGKKLFRQKGSGTARQGERRVPHQRHGGVAHGPKPRDYSQKINRKMKSLAFQRALFERASEGGLSVIEALEVKEPKTKLFDKVLSSVLPKRGKVLIVDDAFESNTALAARNIDGVSLSEAGDLSVLDVVRYRHIIVSEKGIETVIARANGGAQ